MLRLYCHDHHRTSGVLCPECADLLEYARRRLRQCPFGADKPTCARCPIHCYRPDQREKIRRVMRYAGPRMVYRHPWLALLHLLDSQRKVPQRSAGTD